MIMYQSQEDFVFCQMIKFFF